MNCTRSFCFFGGKKICKAEFASRREGNKALSLDGSWELGLFCREGVGGCGGGVGLVGVGLGLF